MNFTRLLHEKCRTTRAGLTVWRALRTPQRRGPTGKLDFEETERGMGGVSPLPGQLGVCIALYKLLNSFHGRAQAENGFGEIWARKMHLTMYVISIKDRYIQNDVSIIDWRRFSLTLWYARPTFRLLCALWAQAPFPISLLSLLSLSPYFSFPPLELGPLKFS